ncbi:MAG: beta family protein [Terriglobia bacterium]|jgi:hypothetical protein
MIGHRHYVPILRWKEAERLALRELGDDIRERITPLVQLVPEGIAARKRTPSASDALRKIARDMRECWGTRRLMVDLCRIDPRLRINGNMHPLTYLARSARTNMVTMVPVTGLQRDAAYVTAVKEAVAEDKRGSCLRLLRADLSNPSLRADVQRFLKQLQLEPNQVDLVLDMECHDDSYPDFDALPTLLPNIREWRSFVVASGAFPPDLTQWKTPGAYPVRRRDWLAWLGEIELKENLVRKPTFSDYGIYHPTYKPPPGFPNFSASIRYTGEDEWTVMRGEGVRNESGAGYAQWPANAELLCSRPEFQECGPGFSPGDAYIAQEVGNYAHPGTPSKWLQAGFNDHMTFVARQIAIRFGT